MIAANLTDFDDLCKPNFSGPKSGKFVVIDSVFYARLEKKNLSADSPDVILMDKKRQIVKMILYHELARQYAIHDSGTVLQLNNLTIKKDDYVRYFGSPFNVTVNISKTDQIAIDEDLTEQWKDYLKILLFEQMSAAEFKQFNGLKLSFTINQGFVGSVFFETNDDPPKNVQMAFFNEHVFTMPAPVVNTDYVIKHSHIKEKQLGKPVYSDFDIAATEKVEFECTQNASNTIPTMTLAELKSRFSAQFDLQRNHFPFQAMNHMPSCIRPNNPNFSKFGNCCIYDVNSATDYRSFDTLGRSLDFNILKHLGEMVASCNPYAQCYKRMDEILMEQEALGFTREISKMRLKLIDAKGVDPHSLTFHPSVYEAPTCGNMIAVYYSCDAEQHIPKPVHPRYTEMFAVRLLAMNRTFITSFEELRTVDNVIHESFVEAAKKLHFCLDVNEDALHIVQDAPLDDDGSDHFLTATEMHEKAEATKAQLNLEQQEVFQNIMQRFTTEDDGQRLFFLNGSGGCGKTFLYNTLYYNLRDMHKHVLFGAHTGVAHEDDCSTDASFLTTPLVREVGVNLKFKPKILDASKPSKTLCITST
ncbi:hypothetical protein L596_016223 [Steinernema carpocapsae]|uniref:ATP-dependent DNA helicase n=1 Tax=Steinernema carpocapsae TaxID=34508 RepID=A0A4V6A3B2_STECR|nr:hypothetical protein L596_016223 [Steinernema carpocapsae]